MYVGIFLVFSKMFYWFQFQSKLGPLTTAITSVIKDVKEVSVVYFIFYLAFTTGMHIVLHKDDTNCTDSEVVIIYNTSR